MKGIPGECWEYALGRNPCGYGMFYCFGKGKMAHRWSLEIQNNCNSPPAMDVSHLCGNRICVRPEHLRYCSRSENILDTIDTSKVTKGTPEKVRYIRQVDWGKTTITELSELLDLDKYTIWNIRAGRTRKNVSDDGPIWKP